VKGVTVVVPLAAATRLGWLSAFTPDRLSTGPECPFCLPLHCDRARDFALTSQSSRGAVLDTRPPSPSTTLLPVARAPEAAEH
jgi:hypothetical protein